MADIKLITKLFHIPSKYIIFLMKSDVSFSVKSAHPIMPHLLLFILDFGPFL